MKIGGQNELKTDPIENINPTESTELIVVRQIPVIEDQLRFVKPQVEARANAALSLVCTEDTYKEIKRERAALNREYAALEAKRKEVKAAIMGPYEQFEAVYKDCVGGIYAEADKQLKAKIAAVEDGLKQQKTDELIVWYDEYRASLGIDADLAPFERAGITVTLSDSKKSLRAKAQTFLDRIRDDLAMIATQEHQDEILVEYRKTLNASGAILTVTQRHQAAEAEKTRREAMRAAAEARAAAAQAVAEIVEEEEPDIMIPVAAAPDPELPPEAAPPKSDDPVMRATFTVTAPRSKLIELRNFLKNGGYEYV